MTEQVWKVSFETTTEKAPHYGDLLEDYTHTAFEISEKDKLWKVEIYLEEQPDLEAFKALLEVQDFKVEDLGSTDWVAKNYESFPPIEIGPFFIHGSHIKPKDLNNINIQIDAATAFGSGSHETTQGCLELMMDWEGLEPPKNALDMGCGSGILAFAVSKYWALHGKKVMVTACDNDEESVRVAKENAISNKVENVSIICGDGFNTPEVIQNAPYDVILANILANPLCDMAPAMVKSLKKEGRIILSGLLVSQIPQVLSAYEAEDMVLENTLIIGDWAALMVARG